MGDRDSDSAAASPALTLGPLTHAALTRFYAESRMGTTVHRPTPGQRTSEEWLEALRARDARRDRAIADLHAFLLRSARFEVGRRRAALSHVRGEELEDVAMQAADDALMAVLSKLDHYRGASRFTTWAYKFALLEAGVRLRRRAWQGREVVLEPEAWPSFGDDRASAQEKLEQTELLAALKRAISEGLTSHQRDVFVALALNQVPIDVLAERLNTTRGALYKTLHDARRKLRHELVRAGFAEANASAIAPQEE
jgi:RNA polymerase sigma-70 factor, ECF subfamily